MFFELENRCNIASTGNTGDPAPNLAYFYAILELACRKAAKIKHYHLVTMSGSVFLLLLMACHGVKAVLQQMNRHNGAATFTSEIIFPSFTERRFSSRKSAGTDSITGQMAHISQLTWHETVSLAIFIVVTASWVLTL